MKLRELFTPDVVNLDIQSESKDDILKELIGLLGMDEKSEAHPLQDPEKAGEPGIYRNRKRDRHSPLPVPGGEPAYGWPTAGNRAEWTSRPSMGTPYYNFFLIVAPPLEVSNQYLPVLGKIAQFAKDPEVPDELKSISSPEEFLKLLEEKAQ